MSEINYLDFDLLIERTADGYRAQVVNSPAGQATADFQFPFSDLELENFFLRVGQTRRVVRRIDSPETEATKAFGSRLFNAIFPGDVRGCLRSSLDEASQQGAGLRLRLRLAGVPELLNLPWEYLYNQSLNRFMALSVETPLVRYLDLPERIQPLHVRPPLKMLVMISSPSDYPALDVEREWAKLNEALRDLIQRGKITLERLETATLAALQKQLRRDVYHIFHFVGHGGFDEQAQDGVLLMETDEKRGRAITGSDLGVLLHDERTLRLAMLNACEGARTSRTDPFAGTAQSLVQQGLPAVIGMQFEISDEAAIVFSREFYSAVADGYPVDAALAEARKAIFAEGNPVEWGTPVLYLRAPDGRIFDIEAIEQAVQAPPAQPTPRPEPVKPPQVTPETKVVEQMVQAPPVQPTPRPKPVKPPQVMPERKAVAPPATRSTPLPVSAPPVSAQPAVAPSSPTRSRGINWWLVGSIVVAVAVAVVLLAIVLLMAISQDTLQIDSFDATPQEGGFVKLEWAVSGTVTHIEISGDAMEPVSNLESEGSLRVAISKPTTFVLTASNENEKVTREISVPAPATAVASLTPIPTSRSTTTAPAPISTPTPVAIRLSDWKTVVILKDHKGTVSSAVFSPDGKWLVTASWDDSAIVWETSKWRQIKVLTGHKGELTSAAFNANSKYLVTASLDGTAIVWNTDTWKPMVTLADKSKINGAAFGVNDRYVVTADADNTARIWEVASGKVIAELRGHTGQVTSATFSPDGRYVVTTSADGTARVWDTDKKWVLTGELIGHKGEVWCADISRDGKLIVTGGEDGTLRVWDATSRKNIHTLTEHKAAVYGVTFSADSRLLVTASGDATARIWETGTWKSIAELRGHTAEVYSVAFGPGNKYVVTGSADDTARVWMASGQ